MLGDGGLESVEALTLPCSRSGRLAGSSTTARRSAASARMSSMSASVRRCCGSWGGSRGYWGVTGVVGAGYQFTQRGRGVEHARHASARIDLQRRVRRHVAGCLAAADYAAGEPARTTSHAGTVGIGGGSVMRPPPFRRRSARRARRTGPATARTRIIGKATGAALWHRQILELSECLCHAIHISRVSSGRNRSGPTVMLERRRNDGRRPAANREIAALKALPSPHRRELGTARPK